MVERLVILASVPRTDDAGETERLRAAGGRVLARYGERVWVVELPTDGEPSLARDPRFQGPFAGAVPEAVTVDDEAGRLGIAAWNLRQSPSFRASRDARRGEGRAWDDDEFEPEG